MHSSSRQILDAQLKTKQHVLLAVMYLSKLLDVEHPFQLNKTEGAIELSLKYLTISNFLNFEQVKPWRTIIIIVSVVILCQTLIIITLGICFLITRVWQSWFFWHGICYEKHNFPASFWVHCIVVFFNACT